MIRRTTGLAILLLLAGCAPDPDAGLSVLHRGLGSDPETLDAQRARSTQAGDVLRDIGEGLVGYSPAGEIVPAAASQWQVSEDGLRYTFTIRDGARWETGETLKAGDFVRGLRRLVDPAIAAFYASAVADIENASRIIAGEATPAELGVEAIDDRTLDIRLDRPVPYLLGLLTHPSTFPAHERIDNGAQISNGAYRLAEWRPGAMLRLERNDQYWNAASTAIDVVIHHVITEELAELNRFRAGELHTTSNVPPENFDGTRAQFGEQLRVAPYLGVYYYGFNLAREPFADNLALRRALSMAIDRDVLVERITRRGEAPAWSWVPPGTFNYAPPQLSFAALDQDERNQIARSLYTEAGYGDDNPLRIELRYNNSATQRRIAVAVQSMWHDVLGVEAELVGEEFQVLLNNVREREVTQVFRASWIGDYNDANTFLDLMRSNNPSNTPGYSNPEFDSLMQRAAKQGDPGRRRLYLEEAERALLADHAVIPIYFYVSKHLVSPEVSGWQDNILDYHYSQHLSLDGADQVP